MAAESMARTIYVRKDDWAAWKLLALATGVQEGSAVSVSEYIRRAVEAYAPEDGEWSPWSPTLLREAVAEIRPWYWNLPGEIQRSAPAGLVALVHLADPQPPLTQEDHDLARKLGETYRAKKREEAYDGEKAGSSAREAGVSASDGDAQSGRVAHLPRSGTDRSVAHGGVPDEGGGVGRGAVLRRGENSAMDREGYEDGVPFSAGDGGGPIDTTPAGWQPREAQALEAFELSEKESAAERARIVRETAKRVDGYPRPYPKKRQIWKRGT